MSKIRITTYNTPNMIPEMGLTGHLPEGMMILKEDRLVEMATEFRNGPKDKHTGPIRLEIMVSSKDEVEAFIDYLSKLALDVPIQKKEKTFKSKTQPLKEDSRKELIETIIKSAKLKTIEDTLDYLRSLNFTLLTREHFDDILYGPDSREVTAVNEKHLNYQIMVRQLRHAKDPKNDKFDTSLFFAIKILGNRFPKIHIYTKVDGTENDFDYSTIKRPWKEQKEVQFKVKQKFYKFPKEMDYDERAKWRAEDRKLLNAQENGKEYIPSKFYYRWKEQVTILQPLKLKKK